MEWYKVLVGILLLYTSYVYDVRLGITLSVILIWLVLNNINQEGRKR